MKKITTVGLAILALLPPEKPRKPAKKRGAKKKRRVAK
jgi:hypothetical protein